MAEDKSSFDIVGKSWNTAKIYGGSNAVKRYDAVVESDSLVTLGDFVRDPKKMIETRGIDFDEKADDRLQKYNVVKITPTRKLDEVENNKDKPFDNDDIDEVKNKFKAYMLKRDSLICRKLIRTFVEKIVVYRDKIEVIIKTHK